MKKIYIAGCGGMLGEAFYNVFRTDFELECSDIDVNAPWLSYMDIRDFLAYQRAVENFKPDYLFHLGACTDLEECERDPRNAYLTNTIGVENAAYIANKFDIPMLYISTAGIFDGQKKQYDEWDTPNPLGCYARSKYAGELFVREHVHRHFICRAGWMMGGGGGKDKKFVHKIMQQLRAGKTEIYVVNDRFGSPTYTYDFAANVKALIETDCWGVYNMVGEGVAGRVEVAKEILKIAGYEERARVVEVPSSFFNNEYFAERPSSECLINARLDLRNMNTMRHWSVALKEYMRDYCARG